MTKPPHQPFATIDDDDPNETTFAQGRLTGQVYTSDAFPYARPASSDNGNPARFVYQVFDNDSESELVLDGEEYRISETPKGRFQFKLIVVRDIGRVKELWIHRVPAKESGQPAKVLLNLKGEDAQRLVDMLKALEYMPLDGTRTRLGDDVIRELLDDPMALQRAYGQQQSTFRELIADDPSASDVIAIASRREQVRLFHRYMEDDDFFAEAARTPSGSKPEAVWQRFFEANPWILGVGLGSQLLTSWDDDKLEKATTGRSIWGVGKRIDALMETSGRIRMMVFAEVKTHRTPLLKRDHYREGCWAPAEHLAGGVAQVQGTVHRAAAGYLDRVQKQNADGTDRLGDLTYLLRPKSYLIIGRLDEFISEGGGHHSDKVRSFELYRRHLAEPEIITFDELLARADWLVDMPAMAVADVPAPLSADNPGGDPVSDPWGDAPF